MSESILKFPMNVTFDTNIFDDCQMDLSENSPFYQLVRYAQQGKIKVYVSNIVYQEMKQHCIEYSEKVCAKIRRTGKDILKGKLEDKTGHRISKAFIDAIDLSYILRIPDEESAKQLSERYLSDFFEKIHVEMLDSQDVNVDSIFDSYFQKKPPFENLKRPPKVGQKILFEIKPIDKLQGKWYNIYALSIRRIRQRWRAT